jgi:hypothetical protein
MTGATIVWIVFKKIAVTLIDPPAVIYIMQSMGAVHRQFQASARMSKRIY